jgi:hypothetical protein
MESVVVYIFNGGPLTYEYIHICVCHFYFFFFLTYGFRLVHTMMTRKMNVDDDATINSLQLFSTHFKFSCPLHFFFIPIFNDNY